MNRYVLIRRLRGPAFLLLVGINALLAQADIIGWGRSWPFYLILAGLLALAERAALAADGPPNPYGGASYTGAPYTGVPYAGDPNAPFPGPPPTPQGTSTSIVPTHSHDFDKDPNGGQR
jgi:hypothetical protein